VRVTVGVIVAGGGGGTVRVAGVTGVVVGVLGGLGVFVGVWFGCVFVRVGTALVSVGVSGMDGVRVRVGVDGGIPGSSVVGMGVRVCVTPGRIVDVAWPVGEEVALGVGVPDELGVRLANPVGDSDVLLTTVLRAEAFWQALISVNPELYASKTLYNLEPAPLSLSDTWLPSGWSASHS